VFSFLLLVQRLCATEDSLNQGLCPGIAWSVRRQPPRVLTETEPFPDHFRTICSRHLLRWLNSDGRIILEVRETTLRLREQHWSTPGLTQRYQSASYALPRTVHRPGQSDQRILGSRLGVEYGKFKRPFPPTACAHPLLPLVLAPPSWLTLPLYAPGTKPRPVCVWRCLAQQICWLARLSPSTDAMRDL
jgi:hypothetical protein